MAPIQFVSTAADLQPVICRIIRAHYEQGKDAYMSDLQLIVANVCTDQTVDTIAAFFERAIPEVPLHDNDYGECAERFVLKLSANGHIPVTNTHIRFDDDGNHETDTTTPSIDLSYLQDPQLEANALAEQEHDDEMYDADADAEAKLSSKEKADEDAKLAMLLKAKAVAKAKDFAKAKAIAKATADAKAEADAEAEAEALAEAKAEAEACEADAAEAAASSTIAQFTRRAIVAVNKAAVSEAEQKAVKRAIKISNKETVKAIAALECSDSDSDSDDEVTSSAAAIRAGYMARRNARRAM
jgi:hypothetical protein